MKKEALNGFFLRASLDFALAALAALALALAWTKETSAGRFWRFGAMANAANASNAKTLVTESRLRCLWKALHMSMKRYEESKSDRNSEVNR